jgi:hypothetical protein
VATPRRPLAVLAVAALTYFAVFPEDLAPVERVLGLSWAVSPWLYGLLAVGLACRTATRIWGLPVVARRRDRPPSSTMTDVPLPR